MRTSTWDNEWVYGLYDSVGSAEAFIRQAESDGVKPKDLVVLAPERLQGRPMLDIMPETHHPEWRGIVVGIVSGFVLGSIAGQAIIYFMSGGWGWLATTLVALIPGFGGAIVGGFLGLQMSTPDASLNALYEECGADSANKIMVAVRCDSTRKDKLDRIEELFLRSGIRPIEFPKIH
ncbi:MAG: hypothetical protein COV45_01345 [Deltaproteobacteria bacterium CG11_big_fil_rev_8_21_14_0_20_47_16]|nr:MAG: hypothetical protein COV45_01345 [Deltaproteobacteria bacterium CG11_big_fil_rev_8_21_14_0_20_47_16]